MQCLLYMHLRMALYEVYCYQHRACFIFSNLSLIVTCKLLKKQKCYLSWHYIPWNASRNLDPNQSLILFTNVLKLYLLRVLWYLKFVRLWWERIWFILDPLLSCYLLHTFTYFVSLMQMCWPSTYLLLSTSYAIILNNIYLFYQ